MLHFEKNSPLQQIHEQLFSEHKITVYIKRDDQIHPQISGNKWRKLKYNLRHAKEKGIEQILSFGGAYSNHIHALAHAGKEYDLKTIGIIRGEYDPKNPTIKQAQAAGMTVRFINRSDYRKRHEQEFLDELEKQYPNTMIIPEGGSNKYALQGLSELVIEIPQHKANYIICPCGSGGTSAGILKALAPQQKLISIAVLKKAEYLKQEIVNLAQTTDAQLAFMTEFHQGGYGKITPALIDFISTFKAQHNIQLEPIYNGKMMMAFYQLVEQGYFPQNTTITLIHTGGLQGINGLMQRGILPPF